MTLEAKSVLLLFLINVIYVILGGICFSYLEYNHGHEVSTKHILEQIFHELQSNTTCFTYRDIHAAIASAIVNGSLPEIDTTNNSTPSNKWDALSSILFTISVVTTIGYGHMAPATQLGQLFFIFYAVLGIPLMLVFLVNVGFRINYLNQRIAESMQCFNNPRMNRLLDTLVIVFFGVAIFVLLPAGLFCHMEDWSYITACYYSVVTLSTVGFGDYVIGMYMSTLFIQGIKDKFWYRISVTLWILFGLAWFAGVVNNIQTQFQKGLDRHKKLKQRQMEGKNTFPDDMELHDFAKGESYKSDSIIRRNEEPVSNLTVI